MVDFPVDVIAIRRMLPGCRVDALSGKRFVPLRVALPNEQGFATARYLLLRSRLGSMVSVHCMDLAHGIIVHEVEMADDDGTRMAEKLIASPCSATRIRERRSGDRFVPSRAHPRQRMLERSFAVFDDFVVRTERSESLAILGLEDLRVLFGRAPTSGHGFAHVATVLVGSQLLGPMKDLHLMVGASLADGSRPSDMDRDEETRVRVVESILAKRNCALHERISLGGIWRDVSYRRGRIDPSL